MSLHTGPDQPISLGTGHWTPRRFKIANLVGSLVTVLFALAIIIGAQDYAFQVQGRPGPGMFPVTIGTGLLAFSAAWFVGTLLNRYRVDDEVEPPPDRSALERTIASFAIVCGCAFAMQPLGYPLTLTLCVGILTVLARGRWRTAVIAGPLFAFSTFILVTTVLGVQLPTGILRPLLINFL